MTMYKPSGPLGEKTFLLAIEVVTLSKSLRKSHDYELASQLLRSGTAPGALYREAERAESKRDFVHKLAIGLKEAAETIYWLDLLRQTDMIDTQQYGRVHPLCTEVVKLMSSIIKTTKSRYNLK